MVKKKINELNLKVGSVNPDDANKGIVKVDSKIMSKIGLRPGDVVEIEGEKRTVAIIDRAYPGDIGLEIIKMDGITRRNAGTNMGETVKIRKAEVKEAKKIIIAPAKKGIIVRANEGVLKRGLLGRVIVKGDFITMGARRRKNSMPMGDGTIFSEIFKSLMEGDDFFGSNIGTMMGGFGNDILFVVVDAAPKKTPLIIGPETEITLNPEAIDIKEESIPDVTYDDVGGLKNEILKVREMIELPLRHPEIFERLGIEPPKGVLLHGPPGTGKTLLARAVASETNAHFITINGPEIMSKFYGESEKNLRAKFEEAEKNAPSIIFIDEIDAIAPNRGETQGDVERRVVAQLLSIMDGLKSRGKVVVIAATNRPNDIDPALRRPGRFDREISIGVPDREGREMILKIHSRNMPMHKDVKLGEIARVTHGFVGADLQALVKEAAMIVLRKVFPDLKNKKRDEEDETIPKELLEKLIIKQEDLLNALKVVRPSAMREVLVEVPDIKWEDIGGLNEEKERLKEMVEWPLKNPEAFVRLGVKPPKGVLLYGPPGTGKTLMAKAVANESEANFILIKGPEMLSKWVGESEKAVRKIFQKARETSPTIIFFDEIDSIAPRRGLSSDSDVTERVVNQLLTEMDGIEDLTNVFIIAATNRPDILDPALLRPGRFDRVIFVGVPKQKEREQIFKIHTKNMPLAKDVNLKSIIEKTEGYVGADIESVCREAAILAMREDMNAKEVKQKHFDKALKIVKPSVPKKVESHYKKFEDIMHSARSEKILVEKPNYMG